MSEYKYPPEGTQAGTVIGPGSSTDNAVARFNGTTGESVQNSGVIIDDSDNVTGVESLTVDGLTASRAVVTNGSKTLASSAVTATELEYLSGTTSNVQTQLVSIQSTGLKTGGVLSVGTGGPGVATTFTIALGTGTIVDNTVVPAVSSQISWSAKTNVAVTNIGSQPLTFVALDSGGNVIQQATDFTPAQHRQYIVLGIVVHVSLTVVANVIQNQHLATSPQSQFSDLTQALSGFNQEGNLFSANGANLSLNKTAGVIFRQGSNYATSAEAPNNTTYGSLTAGSFRYYNQTGAATGIVSVIDPNNYDNAGSTTSVPTNKFTIQRIYIFFSTFAVQRGQTVYNSLAEAKAAIQTESFVINSSVSTVGILRAFLIVKQGATALNSASDAFFLEAPKFGGSAGVGGLSVSTMQNAYDNSSTPEILTDSTRGALSIKRGSAADTDAVLETQNNAGTVKFSVTGDGTVTTSLTASRAVVTGASSELASSATTSTELGYVSGVTSAIQTQLNAKAPTASPTFTGTVSGITASMVGLGNVDNTSDASKNAASVTLANKTLTDPIIDDGIRLNHETSVTTPASGKVALFAKSDNQLYLTYSSGVTTAVASPGSGEKNYIPNSTASITGSWGTVGDLTLARTTTAAELPREYTTASGIKITATSGTQSTADYVYFDFTLDDVDLSKKLKISWAQKYIGAYVAGDYAVGITTQADRTTFLHTPATTAIPRSDFVFETTFDSSTTATLSFVIRATTDMTTGAGIVISDLAIGPGTVTQGAAVSEWQSFTPTFNNITVTNNGSFYRRVGSSIEITVDVTASGDATGQVQWNLVGGLTGLTANTSSFGGRQVLGVGNLVCATNHYVVAPMYSGTATYAFFRLDSTSTLLDASNPSGDGGVDGTDRLTFTASFPVSEWAGNGTVNLGAGAQVEYASNDGSGGTAANTQYTTGSVAGPNGSAFVATASTTVTGGEATDYVVNFQYPIQSDDILTIETYWPGTTEWVPVDTMGGVVCPLTRLSTGLYGMGIVPRSTTSVFVRLGNGGRLPTGGYGSAGSTWTGISTYKWRVRKAKASSPVGFGLVTAESSGLLRGYTSMTKIRLNTGNGHGATNTKVRRFTTTVVNTGTGITYADSSTLGATFTCTEAGIYAFEYADAFSGVNDLGLSLNSSQLTTNIGSITAADRLCHATTGAADYFACVSVTIALAVGDVVRPHTSGGAESSVPGRVSFTVQRIA